MSAPVWSQADSGVALALGAIVATAASQAAAPGRVRGTLQRLDPTLAERAALAVRLTFVVATYEAIVGVGVIALRGDAGFAAACALLVVCVAFVVVFGVGGAAECSVRLLRVGGLRGRGDRPRHCARGWRGLPGRPRSPRTRATDEFVMVAAVGLTVLVIVFAQRAGGRVRPGVDLAPDGSLASVPRSLTGYDNDLYSSTS